jgi:NCS1 family nucleobase:cation symporter-1
LTYDVLVFLPLLRLRTKNMIGAIWPSFYDMKNHFPVSAAMETNDFIGFVVFWLISFPLLAVKPERYKIPALVFSTTTIVAVVALLVWALVKNGGGGPLLNETQQVIGVKKLEGAALLLR